MINQLYIYHHNDADGIAAAAMVNLAYPTANKKFISTGYPVKFRAEEFKFMSNPKDITVFFVDLSFKNWKELNELKELCSVVGKVIWIDHHESSINLVKPSSPDYPDNFDMVVNDTRCGAVLTYQYLHPKEVIPKFLGIIDIYDRHTGSPKDLEMATSLNLELMAVPNLSPTSEIWTTLMTGGDVVLQHEMDRGHITYEYLDNYYRGYVKKNAVITKVLGIECICVNAPGNSMLFNSVEDKFPLRLAWHFTGRDYKYSIFSDGSIDCSGIAATFGGGGHPGAAGFSSDQLLFIDSYCEQYH